MERYWLSISSDGTLPAEELLKNGNFLSDYIPQDSEALKKNRIILPGFRMNKNDFNVWKQTGWSIEDYLPCCGIHSTAAAFGIARALREKSSSLFVHYNRQVSGKQVLVLGTTK